MAELIVKCNQCGTEYGACRSTSSFCSSKCKQAFYRNRHGESVTVKVDKPVIVTGAKRGKDIKCFEDLHPGIQRSIDMMSMVDGKIGKIDKTIKTNRTAIAISYQHRFPERYYPQDAVCTGVVIGKPGDQDYNGACNEDWRAAHGR